MAATLELDHIVVSATRLEDGVDYVQDTLGVLLDAGGKHPRMGTHNRLLGLGNTYLEVIAIDPDAPSPDAPRWFHLDRFDGAPRLTNWVAKTRDMNSALQIGPPGCGTPTEVTRDDLVWHVAISEDGTLPFEGAFPGLIDWGTTLHPTQRLEDKGCSLVQWSVTHPDGAALASALSMFEGGMEHHIVTGPFGMKAQIMTPSGLKVLE